MSGQKSFSPKPIVYHGAMLISILIMGRQPILLPISDGNSLQESGWGIIGVVFQIREIIIAH